MIYSDYDNIMVVKLLEQRIGIADFTVYRGAVDTAINRDATRNRGGSYLIE